MKYEFRYEIASERNKFDAYTLIPESNRVAEAQQIGEHEGFQAIRPHALKGIFEEVHKHLFEFLKSKR